MSIDHDLRGSVTHVDTAGFQREVLRSDVPVLVDFYADWCGPCRALAPRLEQLARDNPGAKVVKVDVDTNPSLAMRYGISSIPSLLVFREGEVVAQHVGLASKAQLEALIAR